MAKLRPQARVPANAVTEAAHGLEPLILRGQPRPSPALLSWGLKKDATPEYHVRIRPVDAECCSEGPPGAPIRGSLRAVGS